jgi:EF hand
MSCFRSEEESVMRRLDFLTRVGLFVLMIGVTAPAPAHSGGRPSADPQPTGTAKKPRTATPPRQWDVRLRGLDTNQDGRLTFAEWDADETSFFDRDWDTDGILSGDELVAGAVRPAIPARNLPPGGEPYDVVFERLDANDDDCLSRREFGGTAAAFAQLDFNHDGLLSPFEFGVGR